MKPQRRMGLLGGAFDPPHAAHVALAQSAHQALNLDELRVIPTGHPWHRAHPPKASAEHRLAMCRLAFADMAQTVIDDRESHRCGPSYTIDTVRELRLAHPDAELYLIIGADQARAFQSWRHWQELLRHVHLVVADRDPQAGQWQNTALMAATPLPFNPMDVSATQIRQALGLGRSSPWLDPRVLGYIQQHQLYSTPSP